VALLQLSRLFKGMTKLEHEVIASCAAGVVYAQDGRLFVQGQTFRSLVLLFQSLIQKLPQIERNANQIFSTRLAELEERFREVSTENVNKRLAHIILRLMTDVGRKVGTGIDISPSRDELAQMIGTTLFTVSRIISEWACKGIVIPGRNLITVCSLPLLELEVSS
jgi:CRP-like cAMP-binding protein